MDATNTSNVRIDGRGAQGFVMLRHAVRSLVHRAGVMGFILAAGATCVMAQKAEYNPIGDRYTGIGLETSRTVSLDVPGEAVDLYNGNVTYRVSLGGLIGTNGSSFTLDLVYESFFPDPVEIGTTYSELTTYPFGAGWMPSIPRLRRQSDQKRIMQRVCPSLPYERRDDMCGCRDAQGKLFSDYETEPQEFQDYCTDPESNPNPCAGGVIPGLCHEQCYEIVGPSCDPDIGDCVTEAKWKNYKDTIASGEEFMIELPSGAHHRFVWPTTNPSPHDITQWIRGTGFDYGPPSYDGGVRISVEGWILRYKQGDGGPNRLVAHAPDGTQYVFGGTLVPSSSCNEEIEDCDIFPVGGKFIPDHPGKVGPFAHDEYIYPDAIIYPNGDTLEFTYEAVTYTVYTPELLHRPTFIRMMDQDGVQVGQIRLSYAGDYLSSVSSPAPGGQSTAIPTFDTGEHTLTRLTRSYPDTPQDVFTFAYESKGSAGPSYDTRNRGIYLTGLTLPNGATVTYQYEAQVLLDFLPETTGSNPKVPKEEYKFYKWMLTQRGYTYRDPVSLDGILTPRMVTTAYSYELLEDAADPTAVGVTCSP